ncbi:hypothetical protein Rsub_07536 [Raphidocelis subcapitata]|uniref:Uncharacterized protein n=1 Tax=Raphidocelis subcapitata TaxID=307507 RepID=A0A2V0PD56_9CHLO|nr:hypothetical protein Rsub_07536 [Raphidocelis subcapitata]|eukprot:GBF95035.1 hypothetical protein Rsub_07536 [Raphidocelis subcapitata]
MASAGIVEADASISHVTAPLPTAPAAVKPSSATGSLKMVTRQDYTDAEMGLRMSEIATFKGRYGGERSYLDPTTGKVLAKWGGSNIYEAIANACSSLYGQTPYERTQQRAAVVPAGVSSRGRKRGPPAHFGDYVQHGAKADEFEEYGAGAAAARPQRSSSGGRDVGDGAAGDAWAGALNAQRQQQWQQLQPAALQGGPGSMRSVFGAPPMGSVAAAAAAGAAAAAAVGALNAQRQQQWQQLQPAALQGGPGPMRSQQWQQLQPAALQGGPGPMRGVVGAPPMGSAAAAAAAGAAAAAAVGALNAQRQQQWQQLQPAALQGGPGPMRGVVGAPPMGSAAAAAAAAVTAALSGPGARPSSPYPPDDGADALQPPAKRAHVDG